MNEENIEGWFIPYIILIFSGLAIILGGCLHPDLWLFSKILTVLAGLLIVVLSSVRVFAKKRDVTLAWLDQRSHFVKRFMLILASVILAIEIGKEMLVYFL
ncbi:MAG: hypothetical protein CR972_02430 [Candidatus Moraniibacteriota bacterium]|nr:MAG: hypothetical protein CR972_02430 [Candidatus Moranbacteria bacterium]